MALDRYLMELVRDGRFDFVLRTYGWKPACVSLGRLQKADREIDVDRLLNDGFHLVRRPTGGRQVWHETELTYSIVARMEHPMVSGSISQALKKVAAPMVEAMRSLEIDVTVSSCDSHHVGGPRTRGNPCFTSHGRWEVGTPDGRKLVGSAQARSRGVFLEHGSILFENDQPKLLDYLPDGVPLKLRERLSHHLRYGIASVREFKADLETSEMEEALAVSYSRHLGHEMEELPVDSFKGKRLSELEKECRDEVQKET